MEDPTLNLALPPYHELERFEGKGNYAIWKYYEWPYRYFYRKKLRMIWGLLSRKSYDRVLDFGCGPGIFTKTLQQLGRVKSIDRQDSIDFRWKFDAIICGSVLEFTDLLPTLYRLKMILEPTGELIIASPMDTWLTRLYFKTEKDAKTRHSHEKIIEAVSRVFHVETIRYWFGLYFAMRVRCRI